MICLQTTPSYHQTVRAFESPGPGTVSSSQCQLSQDCWRKADSTVFTPLTWQQRQRKMSLCMKLETAFQRKLWWDLQDEQNFSRKRMECIPSKATTWWTKAGRQKDQHTRKSWGPVWPDGTLSGRGGMRQSQKGRYGTGCFEKTRLPSSDINASQYITMPVTVFRQGNDITNPI